MSITIKQLPETERPYEKLELYGEKALSNAELLAIIIKTGTKEETSLQLAQKILKLNENQNESLEFIQDISIEEFMQIKGIGKVKAIQIKAVCELATRIFKSSNYKKIKVKKPDDIAKFLISELKFQKREILKLIILDNRNQILKIKDVAVGQKNQVFASIREILSEPIKMNAPKIIIAHNHPSGDPTPSEPDKKFTYELYKKANEFDIELLDHIVIGSENYTSIFSLMIKESKRTNTKK